MANFDFFGVTLLLTISIFIFTDYFRYALDYTAIERTLIPIIPISVFLVGVILGERDVKNNKSV